MEQSNELIRTSRSVALVALAALASLSGCSLVIDSGRYVAQTDGGPSDMGSDGGPDGGVDQGPVECNGELCPVGWFCLAGTECVECFTGANCASGACDPFTNACVIPVEGCASCQPDETCVDLPNGTDTACLVCDRDDDGFPVVWEACDAVSPGTPRDCDDMNAQRFPSSVPLCNDGSRQVCPSTELEFLAGLLTSAEFGRLPVNDISGEVAFAPQLSVLAVPGNSQPGASSTADEATGLYGFVTDGGEAAFHATVYGGYDPPSGSHFWRGTRTDPNLSQGWPYDAGSVGAFALGYASNQVYFSVQGQVGDQAQLGVHAVSSAILQTFYSTNVNSGFLPPIAFRGRGYVDVVFRQEHPLLSEFSQLASIVNGTSTDAHFIPDDATMLLDTESGFVVTPAASGFTAEAWDAIASMPVNVAPPSLDRLVGPPRVSRDVLQDRLIALLPYEAGVRVALFNCTPGSLDTCAPVATGIQTVLPDLKAFDFEIHGGVLVVVQQLEGSADVIVAHVLTLDEDLMLTRRNVTPIPLISVDDVGAPITSIHAVETDLDIGPHHLEVVVGVAAALDNEGMHVLGTSLRACSSL